MSKLNIDMIREIKNNHPAVPEPFLNESKLLDVEEDCRKAFLSSRTGRLGAFGRAFHSFIEAPSGDLVSAYILAIDSEDERKADVLLRFYTAPGERAVLLYRDTIAFVPTLYLSSATCKCRGCTAEIDGPQRKSIIEGEDEYNACIAALKTWNTRHADKEA